MTRLAALVAPCLLAASACAHERLVWRFPDGSYDPGQVEEDIHACEEHTAIADDDERVVSALGARAYGGWGSFTFEHCMHQSGWVLTRVPTERAERE